MTNNDQIYLRLMREDDLKQIKLLVDQLGYTIEQSILKSQITDLISHSDHEVFVAIKDECAIAFIHCFRSIQLTSEPFIEIRGLIVDQQYRNQHVGQTLINHVEQFFCKDFQSIRVRCNTKRTSAHKFYENLDFTFSKNQIVFKKALN